MKLIVERDILDEAQLQNGEDVLRTHVIILIFAVLDGGGLPYTDYANLDVQNTF